jgi:hypothetical protein
MILHENHLDFGMVVGKRLASDDAPVRGPSARVRGRGRGAGNGSVAATSAGLGCAGRGGTGRGGAGIKKIALSRSMSSAPTAVFGGKVGPVYPRKEDSEDIEDSKVEESSQESEEKDVGWTTTNQVTTPPDSNTPPDSPRSPGSVHQVDT